MIRLGVYLLIAGLPWMKACSLAVILVRPDSPDVVRLKVAVTLKLAKMHHLGLQRDCVTRASPFLVVLPASWRRPMQLGLLARALLLTRNL